MSLRFDEIDAIVAWLIDGAPGCDGGEQLVSQLCERLVAAGLPLAHLRLSIQMLHPDVAGVTTRWRPDEKIQSNIAPFAPASECRSDADPHADGTTDDIVLPLTFARKMWGLPPVWPTTVVLFTKLTIELFVCTRLPTFRV